LQGEINGRRSRKNQTAKINKEEKKKEGDKQGKTVPGGEQPRMEYFFFYGASSLAESVLLHINLPPVI
jgi:hypothetical protein